MHNFGFLWFANGHAQCSRTVTESFINCRLNRICCAKIEKRKWKCNNENEIWRVDEPSGKMSWPNGLARNKFEMGFFLWKSISSGVQTKTENKRFLKVEKRHYKPLLFVFILGKIHKQQKPGRTGRNENTKILGGSAVKLKAASTPHIKIDWSIFSISIFPLNLK